MKLAQIREKVAYLEQPKSDLKTASRLWTSHAFKGTVALTLTLKRSFKVASEKGIYYKKIDKDECHRIAQRFKKKLNQAVYGNAVKRYQKSLRYLIAVEGGAGGLNLHIHMVIGEFPEHVKFNQIEDLIIRAKNKVAEIDKQYELKICDSGWNEYAVKTIGKNNTDSILWDLA